MKLFESPGISVFPATEKFSQLMMKSDRVTFTEVCLPRWRLRCIFSHAVSFSDESKKSEKMLSICPFDWEFHWITEI